MPRLEVPLLIIPRTPSPAEGTAVFKQETPAEHPD